MWYPHNHVFTTKERKNGKVASCVSIFCFVYTISSLCINSVYQKLIKQNIVQKKNIGKDKNMYIAFIIEDTLVSAFWCVVSYY